MAAGQAIAPVLIVGCGNEIAGDDSFGVLVARRLRLQPDTGVEVVELGIRCALLDQLTGRRGLLVIDAAVGPEQAAGEVFDLDWYAADPLRLAGDVILSSHGLGVASQLALAGVIGWLPARIRLLGVTITDLAPAFVPSKRLHREVEEVARLVREHARSWVHEWAAGGSP